MFQDGLKYTESSLGGNALGFSRLTFRKCGKMNKEDIICTLPSARLFKQFIDEINKLNVPYENCELIIYNASLEPYERFKKRVNSLISNSASDALRKSNPVQKILSVEVASEVIMLIVIHENAVRTMLAKIHFDNEGSRFCVLSSLDDLKKMLLFFERTGYINEILLLLLVELRVAAQTTTIYDDVLISTYVQKYVKGFSDFVALLGMLDTGYINRLDINKRVSWGEGLSEELVYRTWTNPAFEVEK